MKINGRTFSIIIFSITNYFKIPGECPGKYAFPVIFPITNYFKIPGGFPGIIPPQTHLLVAERPDSTDILQKPLFFRSQQQLILGRELGGKETTFFFIPTTINSGRAAGNENNWQKPLFFQSN